MNKKNKKRSLALTHPELSAQWHPTKNGTLSANDITAGSGKKAWWQCKKNNEHIWKGSIGSRAIGSGCPYCSNQKVDKSNCLATTHSELVKEWHPTKNGILSNNDITAGSGKKAWWQCKKNNEHIWKANTGDRARGGGCPYCLNKKVDKSNCLAITHPELAKEWHPTKNGTLLPNDVTAGSDKKAYWQCKKNNEHIWKASIGSRAIGSGCSYCSNQKVNKSNCLATTHPELAAQWHTVKNNNLTPYDVTAGSHKKTWWQCPKDQSHEWIATIENRAKMGRGCPYCNSGWTIEKIRSFIISLIPFLDTFSSAELYAVFQQNGLLASNGKGSYFVKNFLLGKLPKEEIISSITDSQKFAQLIDQQKDEQSSNDDAIKVLSEEEEEVSIDESDLPVIQTKDILSSIDNKIVASADEETIDFLIKSAVAKIWKHIFQNENEAQVQLKQYEEEGEYSKEVKKLFLEGYRGAKDLEIPEGYNDKPPRGLPKKEELGLMQRYVAYQIKKNMRFGNWSGTGAGKTLSAILASRVINAKLTIICCPNNVIDTWKKQIEGSYPDSVIYTKESILKIRNDSKSKYLLLNYEFFQQSISENKLKSLVDNCVIDFIVIDEIHQSKQREAKKISKRKMLVASFLSEASNKNIKLSVLGMSATPVVNNLFEGKTLLELITGIYHDDLNTQATIANCVALYKKFVSQGIRYLPNYKMQFNLHKESIDCSHLYNEIKEHKSWVELEGILTKAKLSFILEQLQPKTIVYTHYRDGIEIALQEAISKRGWNVAFYNGNTKEGLSQFINGNVDILIATSCIGTGIDGLQEACNRLIINCLPWTHAEYKQLTGRIYRQGQIKDTVDIIIPLTFAEINGERWSWCESRWGRIKYKRDIANAAVDGEIPEGQLRSSAQAHKDIMKWFDRLSIKGLYEVERSKMDLKLSGDFQQSSLRRVGDLSRMNQRINNESSHDTHNRFLQNPEEWYEYHASFRATRESWPIIPSHEALKWCQVRPDLIIGDFGCGEALLVQELKNKVYSFDHVAINENVIACDMAQIPLENETIDAGIFSLSLMGTNFIDYLKEAKRCLKRDGWLWIAEPTSRIHDTEQFKELLKRLGFYMIDVESKDRFTFIKALKSEREINEVALKDLLLNNIFC